MCDTENAACRTILVVGWLGLLLSLAVLGGYANAPMMGMIMSMLFMGFPKKVILEDAPALKQVGRRSAEVAELW